MENIELYFLRSFEADIAKEILHFAARLDDENKTLADVPQIHKYIEHYGIHKTDIGVYAMVDGVVAGAAWVRLLNKEDKRGFGYVDDNTPELVLGVRPEFRNHNVGTKLMQQLMSEVAMSFDTMSLAVREDNPVISLYTRLGFTKVKGSQTYHKDRDIHTFVMIKTLEKASADTREQEWFKATERYRNDIY